MLPLGKHGDYKMRYFRNEGILTKQFIIGIIRGKPVYHQYLPDNAKLENLTKDFLFSVNTILTFSACSLSGAWCVPKNVWAV